MLRHCSLIDFQSIQICLSESRKLTSAILPKRKLKLHGIQSGAHQLPPHFLKRIDRWKEFLKQEFQAMNKQRRDQNEELLSSLTVKKTWIKPFEGVHIEFSLDGLGAEMRESLQNRIKLREQFVLFDNVNEKSYKAVVIENRNGRIVVRLCGKMSLQELNDVERWNLQPSPYDPAEMMQNLLHSGGYKKLTGFDLLLKSYKIRSLNKTFKDKKIEISKKLDDAQRQAVLAVINNNREFIAIHGPPGTGKTKVIAEIVYQCMKSRKRVIICAPSNMAVDNALMACIERGIDVQKCIRLGFPQDQNERLQPTFLTYLLKQHKLYGNLHNYYEDRNAFENITDNLDIERLKNLIKRSMEIEKHIKSVVMKDIQFIFCTPTCSAVYNLFEQDIFKPDLIIMDEASQMVEMLSWSILLWAPRFVIAGDHQQLGPMIYSTKGKEQSITGYSKNELLNDDAFQVNVSLLERIMKDFKDKKNFVHMLNINYRSNHVINHWSNKNFYEGKLIPADKVKDITLRDLIKSRQHDGTESTSIIDDPLVLLDTSKITEEELRECQDKYPFLQANDFIEAQIPETMSYFNQGEALCIAHHLLSLAEFGFLKSEEIGCITPYRAQTIRIKEILKENFKDCFRVSSVDAFQGQQREAILMSFVRNNEKGNIGFLGNLRRMNVAITRAKRQFFLIASSRSLKRDPLLEDLYSTICRKGRVIGLSELLLNNPIKVKLPTARIE